MKIEIPESVKAVLRCGECDELLSCGPVFLVHGSSEAICGRCSQQPPEEEEASASTSENRNRSRNIQYEAVAKLLLFPCRYSPQGCPEKLDFSEDASNIHERDCKFRTFICPIVARGSCNWVGSRQKLRDHCRDKHRTHFVQNPFVLPRPDLTKSNLSNFLVSAFNFLFLVHLKVCTTSGRLFHSVRMFGDSELLDKFSYSLQIEGNDSQFVKKSSVLRPGILMLQEPSANCILINSLLRIFDGIYNELKFTITIQTAIKFCFNCFKNIEDVSEFCGECRGKIEKCEFTENGCVFVDVNKKKCEKHERYFCKNQTKCSFCQVNFVDGSFIEHLSSSTSCRKTTKANNNSIVRVTRNDSSNWNFILFSSNNVGTVIGSYYLSHSHFELFLFTSLPSHELKNYKCTIELTDPQTKHSFILIPQIQCYFLRDWSINKKMYSFPSSRNIGIDMKINIEKF